MDCPRLKDLALFLPWWPFTAGYSLLILEAFLVMGSLPPFLPLVFLTNYEIL